MSSSALVDGVMPGRWVGGGRGVSGGGRAAGGRQVGEDSGAIAAAYAFQEILSPCDRWPSTRDC